MLVTGSSTATGVFRHLRVENNILTDNGGYGLNFSGASVTEAILGGSFLSVAGNVIGTGATANASGGFSANVAALATGTVAADPGFADAAGGDYEPSDGVAGLGVPSGPIGYSTSTSHVDPGAVQREEAGGALLDPADVKTGVDIGDGTPGTYTGADRWTDPGVANVLDSVSYKADSTTNNRTGTYDAAATGISPPPSTWKSFDDPGEQNPRAASPVLTFSPHVSAPAILRKVARVSGPHGKAPGVGAVPRRPGRFSWCDPRALVTVGVSC